ncbi:MAG: hypothetical protein CVT98_00390 [Bacteroidetes bacterium HGW-Bacteroidetes-15]|nr:MAG: hypothetical protein CVT98_00390 [Bacteroidetes bacterium HGW-Bacteroidetes-15]
MSIFVSKQNVKENFYASILYIAGAAISLLINVSNYYFLPLWLPIGLTAGYLYFKNPSILPGIFIASFISHIYLTSQTIDLMVGEKLQFFPVLFVSITETFILYTYSLFKKKWDWKSASFNRILKLKLLVFISVIMPIPITIIQAWFLVKTVSFNFNSFSFASLFITNAIGLVVFIPLFFSWFKKSSEKLFESISSTIIYGISTLFLVSIVLLRFSTFLWLTSSYLYFFVPFAYMAYISINYSPRVYTTTLAVFTIIHLYLISFFSSTSSILLNNAEDLIYLLVLAITAHYLKDKMSTRIRTIDSLKTNFEIVEEEINRQVEEYKNLNNKLFEEIEKRGLAEKELAQSRKLLSDAQEVSRISTWEYSLINKKFKWVSHNIESPLLDFDIESTSLKSIATRVHPDDLKKVIDWNKKMANQSDSFEIEIRLRRKDGDYGYYLVRGKSISDKKKVSRVLGLIMDITERKRSEVILLEKEEKFKALFDSNIDPICVIDSQNGKIHDVNPAFESLYGYSRKEIIGESYLVVSAQPEETRSSIAFGRHKGSYRVTNRIHKKKSGEQFFIEANLMKHQLDGMEMLFIITHDITRRKLAENSLAEREQKFRTFFDSDIIGMAEVSIAKELLSFNEKFTQILGYTSKEFKLKTWDSITYDEDLITENRLFNQVLTHEILGYSIEKRFISKSSELIQCKVSLKAIKSSQGNISHLIIMIDDITERKRAEAEIRESRAKLSQAQAVAKLGSIRFFPSDNNVSISDEAYEILGFGNKKPIMSRKDFFGLILPSSNVRFEELICDLENGISVEGDHEQSIIAPNGEVRYILVNFGISYNNQNQVNEVLATMADITRIKQAEMALIEANTLKDQLFSIIGHDLRSPIGSMNHLIDMYVSQRKLLDEKTSDSILETLSNTSHETYKLLDNLLEWAKSQKSESFKPEKTDLVLIIEQVLTLSKGIADSKSISLQKNLPTKAIVMVDIEMIKTVFRNLISNSIKFTQHSGIVMVSLSENSDFYNISISDTGVGIDSNIIPKLFDNTSSFTTFGTNNERGSGLGLKLVKKFVEKNGGQISVESQVGQGSKFTFSIPKFS